MRKPVRAFHKNLNMALVLLLAGLCAPAHAQDKVCVLQGEIKEAGRVIPAHECFENQGESAEDFKFICDAMHGVGKDVSTAGGTAPPTLSYAGACPPKAVAKCQHFLNRAVTSYHYKRTVNDLAVTRESCITQGGKWIAVAQGKAPRGPDQK